MTYVIHDDNEIVNVFDNYDNIIKFIADGMDSVPENIFHNINGTRNKINRDLFLFDVFEYVWEYYFDMDSPDTFLKSKKFLYLTQTLEFQEFYQTIFDEYIYETELNEDIEMIKWQNWNQ